MTKTTQSVFQEGPVPLKKRGRPVKHRVTLAPPSLQTNGITKQRIQSIEGFVNEHFSGDLHAFRKHYGLVMQKIMRWIDNHALISEKAVYLRKSNFNDNMHTLFIEMPGLHDPQSHLFSPTLVDFVRFEYDGNMSVFADANGITQQQAHRWIKQADCLWAMGEVYRKQEVLVSKSE